MRSLGLPTRLYVGSSAALGAGLGEYLEQITLTVLQSYCFGKTATAIGITS